MKEHPGFLSSKARRYGRIWGIVAALAVLFVAKGAHAQLELGLEFDKKTFMTYEPVTATLTMVNRAGKELVIDGPNGGSWLDFQVIDGRQNLIPPVQGAPKPQPMILPAGAPHRIRVMVNHSYPMSESGLYRIKVRVYFPPLGRYFETRVQTVNIVDGQVMWGPQVVGVPAGLEGAGSYRAYTLLTFFQGAQKRSIYFRLADNDTGRVRSTFSLGEYMSIRPPQHIIDNQSRLHVLHMATPQQYFYTIIDTSGNVVSQTAYREKGMSRPEMVTNASGEVTVMGGVSEQDLATPYEEKEFRKLSERPPGLPAS